MYKTCRLSFFLLALFFTSALALSHPYNSDRTHNAIQLAVKHYKKIGKNVPNFLLETSSNPDWPNNLANEDKKFLTDWIEAQMLGAPTIEVLEHKALKGGLTGTEVYKIKTKDGVFVFRPVDLEKPFSIRTVRGNVLASQLNKALGLDTTARSWFAFAIDPKTKDRYFGAVSEFVKGERPKDRDDIDQEILKDIEAFEYLVGNTDVGRGNVHISPNYAKVFDYGHAFYPGQIHVYYSPDFADGVPISYSNVMKDWIIKTRNGTRTELVKMLKGLTKKELNGVLFRLEVMYQDIHK